KLMREKGGEQGRLYRLSERGFDALHRAYEHGLDWVLRHRGFTLLVTGGTLVLSVMLFATVPKGLFPQQDAGALAGFSQAPQDVSFQTMRARQEAVNAVVQSDPDVLHVVSFIGAANGSTGNNGTVFVDLKPKPPRKLSADQIIARLRPKLA